MTFETFKSSLKISGTGTVTVEGVTIGAEELIKTITMRIWKSAQVVKNKREADKGGIKLVVSQALAAKLITKDEAFDIVMLGDKAKAAELREKLPKTEKTEDPSDEDVAVAIRQVTSGKGQSA